MTIRNYTWSITNATERQAAEYLDECRARFPAEKRGSTRRQFIFGIIVGVIIMASMNIGDLHICAGECDDVGVVLIGDRK